jgi:hypothetical protein
VKNGQTLAAYGDFSTIIKTVATRGHRLLHFAKNLPRGWIFSPKRAGIKKEPPD